MKSKKQLFLFLDKHFDTTNFSVGGLNAQHVSNETYGKKSCIYLSMCSSYAKRRELEIELTKAGFAVNRQYWPGSSMIEVTVSYFKGHHWDE